MKTLLRGRILNDVGFPLEGVTVRLFGKGDTLGGDPRATTANQEAVSWTRDERGLAGALRGVWLKQVAASTAGITWEEFRDQAPRVNPALQASGGRLRPEETYLLPENRHAKERKVLWDRSMTGFSGSLWACWRRYVQGKVVGLNWREFRRQAPAYNPGLTAAGGKFQSEKSYLLPRNPGWDEYVRVEATRKTGRFTYRDLIVGTYRLEVRVEGYEPWTQTVEVDGALKVAIRLKRAKPAPAKGLPVSPQGIPFVQVRGGEFVLENRSFRFIGVNLRGLVHYGSDKFSKPTANQEMQLQEASNMGARVVRVFLPVDNVNWRTDNRIEARLEALLQLMEKKFRHMYLIVSLTNLYSDTSFKVFGDDEGGGKSFYDTPWERGRLLGQKWFAGGYQDSYLKFVQRIVPKFSDRASIMAWEPGNEFKVNDRPDIFVDFMMKVAEELQRLAPNQLVTTGMISTQHAYMDPDDPGQDAQRRRLLSSPHIDFITVHSYNGANEHKEESDARLARALNPPKPIIVEEAGFVGGGKAEKEAERDPKFHIPDSVISRGRPACVKSDMDKWLNNLGARGYMQWAFMAGWDDNEDGDGLSGMDFAIHGREDWDALFGLYLGRANELASQAGPVAGPPSPSVVTPANPPVSIAPMPLQAGQEIRVSAADGLNVRREPGNVNKLPGDVQATLPPGTRLTVLEGPVGADTLTWWAVSFVLQGQTVRGWVAQAFGNTPLIAV